MGKMKKILVSWFGSFYKTFVAGYLINPDKVYALIDLDFDSKVKELKKLLDSLGIFSEIEIVEVNDSTIDSIVKAVDSLLNRIENDSEIYFDISDGSLKHSVSLLLSAFKKNDARIKQVSYIAEDDEGNCILSKVPKMSISLLKT